MDADEKWRRSHEKWADEEQTRLTKLNFARGLVDGERDDVKKIPHILRDMLPPAPSPELHPGDSGALLEIHPCDRFMHKVLLDELVGTSSTSPAESADWFAKLFDASPNRSDGGPLAKSALTDSRSRMAAVIRKLAENAAQAHMQLEYADTREMVDAMSAGDETAFGAVAERVLAKIQQAAVAA